MNVLGIDDELAEEYAPIPPGFTKGYPLPDGWKWQCYDDGSGSLDAPDGESFFAYDLCTGEMTDAEGRWTHVLTSGEIARLLAERVLPDYEQRHELAAQHPDWWVAYGAHGSRDVVVPEDAARVLIAPGKDMDAATFSALLCRAHTAENRNYSDSTISAQEFASRLNGVSPGRPLFYEGEVFDYDDIWGGGGLAGEKGDVRSSQRASLKDMETENRASANALSGYDAPSMNEGPSR